MTNQKKYQNYSYSFKEDPNIIYTQQREGLHWSQNESKQPRRSSRNHQHTSSRITTESLNKRLNHSQETLSNESIIPRRSTRKRRSPIRLDGVLTGKELENAFKNELGIEFLKRNISKVTNKLIWILDKYPGPKKIHSTWLIGYLFSPNKEGVWFRYYGFSHHWNTFIRWDKDLLTRLCFPLVGVLSPEQIIQRRCYTTIERIKWIPYTNATSFLKKLQSIQSNEDMERVRNNIKTEYLKISGNDMPYYLNRLNHEQIRKSLEYIKTF